MLREQGHNLGINPDIFKTIETPVISTGIDTVSDGIPTYATLEVLIAYITSPRMVNYEIGEEFLTVYRMFSNPFQLWQLLASRLLYAADLSARTGNTSENGNIIGQKCFTMIKMWFRQFFILDLMPSVELRSLVAESLNFLSASNEFGLDTHFNNIMKQLRNEWDSQIAKYWQIPVNVAGNVDTVAPVGGDPLPGFDFNERRANNYILNNTVPISADYFVPVVLESPKKLKPKRKISTIFGFDSGSKTPKAEEVTLHNKFDMLAMRVVDQYNEMVRLEVTKLAHEASTNNLQQRLMRSQSPPTPAIPSPLPEFYGNQHKPSNYEIQCQLDNAFIPMGPSDTTSDPLSSQSAKMSSQSSQYEQKSPIYAPLRSTSIASHNPITIQPSQFNRMECEGDISEDEEVWGNSVRFSEQIQTDQLESLNDESKGMPHEPSSDTLNVNNMGLANTTGDSLFEEFVPHSYNSENTIAHNRVSTSTVQPPEAHNSFQEDSFRDSWNLPIDYNQIREETSPCDSFLSSISFDPHTPQSTTRDYSGDKSHISLMSEEEMPHLQPFEGYTPQFGEYLKSLPDQEIVGDPYVATLQRLERSRDGIATPSIPDVTGLSISKGLEHEEYPVHKKSIHFVDQFTNNCPEVEMSEYSKSHQNIKSFNNTNQDSVRFSEIRPQPSSRSLNAPIQKMPSFYFSAHVNLASRPTLYIGLPNDSKHAPFVLSYDARSVAEQMTLIEKEIAKELDRQELIWISSSHHPQSEISSWLDIVVDNNQLQGTDLVMARSGLVYKWVQSEVYYCYSAALKAQAISRFIHIAFESLRLQNFATMTQLVLALSSENFKSELGKECANLLPEHDRKTLNLLQSLANPDNNFTNLRNAHRRICSAKGSVPYTPMFADDIARISQLSSKNTENEIHFGKYHEISKVAHTVMELVDSGDNYTIEPDFALIAKCLHITCDPSITFI